MSLATSAQALTPRVLALTETLMRARSITPDDAGCQQFITEYLSPLGFQCEQIDKGEVLNLWASKTYGPGPHVVLAGHTDVVPTGPIADWSTDPFEPTIKNGFLYGRGAADMKASLAAMMVAVADIKVAFGTISFLITSDEEGIAIDGTKHVVEVLAARGIKPDYCIVGEPSSSEKLGDVVRCGRRGSLNCQLTVKGVQGHVAYPQDAKNPIHLALGALEQLTRTEWDNGNDYFPPTTFQISNINGGTGATNVIPNHLTVLCNFRYNTEHQADALEALLEAQLREASLDFECAWQLSGRPFLTPHGALTKAVSGAIKEVAGIETQLSTGGGTSDGRFIAPWDESHRVDVIELGPCNETIHKIDEATLIEELGPLAQIYRNSLLALLE